jgi:calcium/calmodulin-dependent protein kinase I
MSAKTIPAHEEGQGHHEGEAAGPGKKSSTPGGKRTFKDSYTVGKDLGSGAFSVVKLATHKASNRDTAVKIIQKKKLSEEDLAALMTEISILCELDHPHIIKCFETFDEGNEFYIVTELVAGGELFDRIVAKTHYTEKEARDLVKLFLETMAYMHEKGIVHRDLKPENLLLTSGTVQTIINIRCDVTFFSPLFIFILYLVD